MTKAIEAMAVAIWERDPDMNAPSDAVSRAEGVIAALKANGYAVVPVEPSARQIAFGWKHAREHSRLCYKAMIAAATPHDDGGE